MRTICRIMLPAASNARPAEALILQPFPIHIQPARISIPQTPAVGIFYAVRWDCCSVLTKRESNSIPTISGYAKTAETNLKCNDITGKKNTKTHF